MKIEGNCVLDTRDNHIEDGKAESGKSAEPDHIMTDFIQEQCGKGYRDALEKEKVKGTRTEKVRDGNQVEYWHEMVGHEIFP